MAATARSSTTTALADASPSSLIDAAIHGEVEPSPVESLVISQEERGALEGLVAATSDRSKIPIEWVVDVADNNLNWFIATAYSYDDVSRTLRVAIPDLKDPQWEGYLPLDHRLVHLIECCDERSAALYKHILCTETARVKWKVAWWVEPLEDVPGTIEGEWREGVAEYYGRLSNAVYARLGSSDASSDTRNVFEEVGVDENLKLIEVLGGKNGGREEFEQLVVDGVVQWEAPAEKEDLSADPEGWKQVAARPAKVLEANVEHLERLAEDTNHCLREAVRMRCVAEAEHKEAAEQLQKFVAGGDLKAFQRLADDAERDMRRNLAQRRTEAQESTLAFVERCEQRFWRAASTGLFFRRRYQVGDRVLVLLCQGLRSQAGRVAAVHENETYDVDLDAPVGGGGGTENGKAALGIQIPPEYLRPLTRSAVDLQADKRALIGELYKERRTLKDQLEALHRDREALELRDHLQENHQAEDRREREDREREKVSSRNITPRGEKEEPSEERRGTSRHGSPSVSSRAAGSAIHHHKDEESSRASSASGQPSRLRCWIGSLSCGGYSATTAELATALLPSSAGGALEDGDERLCDLDVIVVALQDCPLTGFDGPAMVRAALGLDEDATLGPDSDWCHATVASEMEKNNDPSAMLLILARREVLQHLPGSENAPAITCIRAPLGLTTVGAFLTLRDGGKLGFVSANVGDEDKDDPVRKNAAVAAHLDPDALVDAESEGKNASSPAALYCVDAAKDCDHAFFVGDLGYGYGDESNEARDMAAVTDWTGLAAADPLLREHGARKVFAGWTMLEPRFSPTADLRDFESDHSNRPPSWSERLLFKSLPSLKSQLHIDVFSKRPVSNRGRDALVSAFSVDARPKRRLAASLKAVCLGQLRAELLTSALPDHGSYGHVTLTVAPCWNAFDRARTTEAYLERSADRGDDNPDDDQRDHDDDSGPFAPGRDARQIATWPDELELALRTPSGRPIPESEHLLLHLADSAGATLGGAVLSICNYDDDDDDGSDVVRVPLHKAGVLAGWLTAQVVLVNAPDPDVPRDDSSSTVDPTPNQPNPTPKSKKSIARSVSKGFKSFFSRSSPKAKQ